MNNKYIFIFLIIVNIQTFIIFGIDKIKAIKNNYRISEKILIMNSIIGGSFGALLGMILFHHKTKKVKFILLIPLLLIIQIIIIYIFLFT